VSRELVVADPTGKSAARATRPESVHVEVRMLAVHALLLVLALFPAAALAAVTEAHARLVDAEGKEVGTATFAPAEDGVRISVQVTGLQAGKHGFHVHAVGKCDAPEFKSAGPHFNPGGKKHGHDNPEGPHAGDLPNLDVGQDGQGKATFVAKGVTLGKGPASLFGKEGTALVVHADPDDGKTDPAGNSGARVACGVIERG
jgi:Cu-Zn family superoxide dismutase